MQHPITRKIKEQFPNLIEKKGVPANCEHRIPFAKGTYWKEGKLQISEQLYDGKHTLFSLIDIRSDQGISYIVETVRPDLFGLYLMDGSVSLEPLTPLEKPDGFIKHLKKDEYGLLYSPKRRYRITFPPGDHLSFFFVINSVWLERYPSPETIYYHKLIHHLEHQKDAPKHSKILTMDADIRANLLHLLTLPKLEDMMMDTAVDEYIIKLLTRARYDLEEEKQVNRSTIKTLKAVRRYVKKQVTMGYPPLIPDIAKHFKISYQQLRLEHKDIYGYSLQSYITRKRLDEAITLLVDTDEPISMIAYTLGYVLNTFQKQFKIHFNMSPTEYRKLYKK